MLTSYDEAEYDEAEYDKLTNLDVQGKAGSISAVTAKTEHKAWGALMGRAGTFALRDRETGVRFESSFARPADSQSERAA